MEDRGSQTCQNLEDARRKLALTNFDYFIIYIKLKKKGPQLEGARLSPGIPCAHSCFWEDKPRQIEVCAVTGLGRARPPCFPSWQSSPSLVLPVAPL